MVVFGLSRGLGDPRNLMIPDVGYGLDQDQWEKLGKELHLDRAVPIQFFYWAGKMLRGDLGNDLTDNRPIGPKLRKKWGPTIKLALAAWVCATLVGVPLGVLSATKRGSIWDYFARFFALCGQALPVFWVAILAILLFSVQLKWLPPATMGEGLSIKNYVMPTIALAWLPAAGYLRFTRSAVLEVLDSEYIKLARAKGVSSRSVLWKHAFRNALLVPLTATGLVLAGFMTGSVLVETVFAWPGIGWFTVQAVWGNNINILVIIIMMFTVLFVTVNLMVDVLYGLIDPRIRYS